MNLLLPTISIEVAEPNCQRCVNFNKYAYVVIVSTRSLPVVQSESRRCPRGPVAFRRGQIVDTEGSAQGGCKNSNSKLVHC